MCNGHCGGDYYASKIQITCTLIQQESPCKRNEIKDNRFLRTLELDTGMNSNTQ
jgi:hypothetical protein